MQANKENNPGKKNQKCTSVSKKVRRSTSADDIKVKKGVVSEKVPGRSTSAPGRNNDSEKMKALVKQWRSEREARLVSRMMKLRPGQKGFSSALFGTVSCSELTAPSTSNVPCPSSSGVSKTVERKAAQPRYRQLNAQDRSSIHSFAPLPSKPNVSKSKQVDRRATLQTSLGPLRPKTAAQSRPGSATQKMPLQKSANLSLCPKTDGPKQGKNKSQPITIRHTLASRLRMEKANPLLGVDVQNADQNGVESGANCKTPLRKATMSKLPPGSTRKTPVASHIVKPAPMSSQRKNIPCQKKLDGLLSGTSSGATRGYKKAVAQNSGTLRSASNIERPNKMKSNPAAASSKQVPTSRPGILRRSRSSGNIRQSLSSAYMNRLSNEESDKFIIRSRSASDTSQRTVQLQVPHSPILEESPSKMESPEKAPNTVPRMRKSVAFYTPLSKTPTSVFSPKPVEIRKRLSVWLEKRGKSVGSFHHLHCFGLKASSMAKDRFSLPRPMTPMPLKGMNSGSPSTHNLNDTITLSSNDTTTNLESESPVLPINTSAAAVSSTPDEVFKDVEHCFNEEDKENQSTELFLPETLRDLQRLIICGYPHDQCEEWLALIRKANRGITDTPHYWECLAALEEARGDFNSAIDCYGRAVTRGAKTTKIEASLEQLWDKFSALNIALTPNKPRTPSRRQTLDPKQIFTTSIIKFALQQKAVKKLSSNLGMEASSLNYVVTPVRRSTRKTTCHFKSTPQSFKNIEEMDPKVVQAMRFQSNSALEPTV